MPDESKFPMPFGGITQGLSINPSMLPGLIAYIVGGCGRDHAHNFAVAVDFPRPVVYGSDLLLECIHNYSRAELASTESPSTPTGGLPTQTPALDLHYGDRPLTDPQQAAARIRREGQPDADIHVFRFGTTAPDSVQSQSGEQPVDPEDRPPVNRNLYHEFDPGPDDSTFGKRGTWCQHWYEDGADSDHCGKDRDHWIHSVEGRFVYADLSAVETMLSQVAVDRTQSAYWRERSSDLDAVEAYLNSLKDHLS